jgi:hypothetical protein
MSNERRRAPGDLIRMLLERTTKKLEMLGVATTYNLASYFIDHPSIVLYKDLDGFWNRLNRLFFQPQGLYLNITSSRTSCSLFNPFISVGDKAAENVDEVVPVLEFYNFLNNKLDRLSEGKELNETLENLLDRAENAGIDISRPDQK